MRFLRPLIDRVSGPWLIGLSAWVLLAAGTRAEPVISEFLADNALGRKDEDGDYEDWIEIHNPDAVPVSLNGWHLTDSASDPTRWTFPEVAIEPGGFLVVVASGKDRRIPGRELHANFRLAAGGEYLGLTRPDGTVASAYSPAYPPQVPDVSYGRTAESAPVNVLPAGAEAHLWIPTDGSLGTDWTSPDFVDAGWSEAVLGLGWDDSGAFRDAIRTDLSTLLRRQNAGVYVRIPFTVSNLADLNELSLDLRYDDGFVAYLNGHPVAQKNVPADWPGGVVADQAVDWSSTGEQGVNGWYYGLYDLASDSDQIYDPASDFDNLDPQWSWDGGAWALGPGNPPWTTIGASSWHPNGNGGGANVQWAIRRWISQTSGTVQLFVAGAKENPGCGNGVTFRVLVNGREQFSRTVAFNDTSGFAAELVLEDLDDGDLIDFVLDPTGTDGDTADGCDGSTFAAQIRQEASRGLDWDSTATRSRSAAEALAVERWDLSSSRDRLRMGTNVLSFHLLNVATDDSDLLLTADMGGRVTRFNDAAARYFTRPSPGDFNSGGADTLGPVVETVTTSPESPSDQDDIIVTALVRQTLRPIASVTLVYRSMFAAEVRLAMSDDGSQGDAAAGDGWWSARIPASAAGPGQMLRWAVSASDDQGAVLRSPPYPDPRRSPQYFGTVITDPALSSTQLPVLHWFLASATGADSDSGARGAVYFDGEFYDNILANLHGQSTRGFPKKSYDFDFNPGHNFRWRRDQPRVDDFNLLTTWADKTHFRNVLAYETYAEAGAPAHFAFPVRVQLNGRFHSLANLVENGDENFLRRLGRDPQGALYKMYNIADSTSNAEKKTRKNEGTQDLAAFIRGFTVGTTATREAFLFDHLDVPEVVNSLAARAITADQDCCHKNYYFYRDTLGSGEWSLFPWDVDLSFGRVWTCTSPCLAYFDQTIYTNTGLYVGQNNRVLGAVLTQPATRQMYLRRVRSLMDQLTQPPSVAPTEDHWRRRTTELRDWIAPEAALDLAKWGTWGQRETLAQAVARIHNEFLPGRRQYLFVNRVAAGALPEAQQANSVVRFGPVEFRSTSGNAAEEFVTITNAHSYAVDLSEWELGGPIRFRFKPGTVLPARTAAWVSADRKAFRSRTVSPRGGERRLVLGDYQGELSSAGGTLTLRDTGGRVVDEVRFDGDPSPAQRQLRVVEIHYHPADDPVNGDDEFIELINLGPDPLDLTGVRFARGIQFEFSQSSVRTLSPGQRIVMVRDPAAFAMAHGSGVPVAGAYSGSLDNGGERLRLEDATGEPILDFTYPSAGLPASDGLGFALVPIDPTAPAESWSGPAQWQVGSVVGGTPGQPEPAPAPVMIPPVVLNEVLTHTDPPQLDSVELHNPTTAPALIGGWWLSDDRQQPKKFRLPVNTEIPAGGFVVFDEDDFNAPTNAPTSFALSSHGDSLWLFSADASGNLTGYSDTVAFPAAANGVSFGRHTNSAGVLHHPAQRILTLGGPNSGPRVGPVLINEVYFAVARGDLPFVELRNTTAAAVPLFNPSHPSHTWRLSGVDFDFPSGFSLPPGGLVLVVGGDTQDFRIRHAIPNSIPVLGPWKGVLQPDGERLALLRPDDPDFLPDGQEVVPLITEDEVDLRLGPPWPLDPIGDSGRSVERVSASAYGNDPASWRASAGSPTPGIHDASNRAPVVRVGEDLVLEAADYPLRVALAGEVEDDGVPGGPASLRVSWNQVDGPGIAELEDRTMARTTVALPGPGRYVLQLTAFDGETSGLAELVIMVSRPPAHRTFIPEGFAWRYHAQGREPAADWSSPVYNDAGWSSGEAQLGFGDGDEQTVVPSSADGARVLTAYFRARFVVPDSAAVTSLALRLLRDDGAAVWINGTEAWRSNLPEGPLSYSTFAVDVVGGADETTFFEQTLPPTLLRTGTNVVAVEVHQQNASSSDISFDLELTGSTTSTNRRPVVSSGAPGTATVGDPTRLPGTWNDDGLPRPALLSWELVSGPAPARFSATNVAAPSVTLPAPGTYQFRFSVEDGEWVTSSETTWIGMAAGDPYANWKARYFSAAELSDPTVSGDDADPDGDHQTNRSEFLAGTHPRDPESVLRLRAEIGTDGFVRLSVPIVPARTYAIQWITDLRLGAWEELEQLETAASEGIAVILDSNPPVVGEARFYRVVTPAP